MSCGQVEHSGAGARGLWAACRAQTRPRLDTLARRVEPVAGWEDLVLPDAELTLLRHIVDQVRGRATVLRSWGLAERVTRGSAVTALFAGGSGTGKTLAAEVIAHELELDMYRIDLAGVVSKYIGETEQNLRRVFDAAEEGGALLMFDEADALFGKRSEVKDSHDRYANIEVSYLLAADGGLPRGGGPGHQPAPRPGRRVPAPPALHRHLPVPRRPPSGRGCGRARSRLGRRSASWISSAWPSWPRAAG